MDRGTVATEARKVLDRITHTCKGAQIVSMDDVAKQAVIAVDPIMDGGEPMMMRRALEASHATGCYSRLVFPKINEMVAVVTTYGVNVFLEHREGVRFAAMEKQVPCKKEQQR